MYILDLHENCVRMRFLGLRRMPRMNQSTVQYFCACCLGVACKYGFSINDLVTLIELLIHTEANRRETEYTVLSNFLCTVDIEKYISFKVVI